MKTDDKIAFVGDGLVDDRFQGVEGNEYPGNLGIVTANKESHIVKILGLAPVGPIFPVYRQLLLRSFGFGKIPKIKYYIFALVQLLRKIAFPISLVYALVVGLRNYLYDMGLLKSKAYRTPIICVGNLSAGRHGKNPNDRIFDLRI